MGLRDLKNNLTVNQSLDPATQTATIYGAWVDTRGAKSVMGVLEVGAWGSGSWTPSLQETDIADASPAAGSDVAASDLEGAFVAITGTGQQNASQRVGYHGTKRYVRLALTTVSSPASLPCAGSIVLEPNAKPAA